MRPELQLYPDQGTDVDPYIFNEHQTDWAFLGALRIREMKERIDREVFEPLGRSFDPEKDTSDIPIHWRWGFCTFCGLRIHAKTSSSDGKTHKNCEGL